MTKCRVSEGHVTSCSEVRVHSTIMACQVEPSCFGMKYWIVLIQTLITKRYGFNHVSRCEFVSGVFNFEMIKSSF